MNFDHANALYPKRKIFVSYHHKNDQYYYTEFSRIFSAVYDVIQDNSLDRTIDSDDTEYVIRRIREDFITGTSCTIVLCGSETYQRKYVDWEIKATLDKEHGLIGVNLPNSSKSSDGKVIVPSRLHDNINSSYALWIEWDDLVVGPDYLKRQIEVANNRSSTLIKNGRELKGQDG